ECSVRVLADGVTSAFAVQSRNDEALLQDLERHLKEAYKFSVVYAGFNAVIHRIVEDLAVETGSRLHPVPVCRGCGDVEPFPVRLTLRGPGGKRRASAVFCDRCLSRAEAEGGDAYLGRLVDSSTTHLVRPAPVVRKRVLFRAGLSRRKLGARKDKAVPETSAVPAVRLAS
ncbi:MAG: hypothetical protein LC772_05330, partial [Chloroflexi bacterium]|nr:hypothetical protein [Chloroflexota bacterium]